MNPDESDATGRTRELFTTYHDAWVAHDADRIASLHTPETVFQVHAGQPAARSPEEVRKSAAETFALVPDLTFEEVSLRFGADYWVAEWRLHATGRDGRPVVVDLVDVVTVEGDRVKAKHSYVDGLAMQAALAG
ncbi:nuclear transport factor 2 family protein [Pseudonocardia sp. TRM90224]|uniref:nuclear transport factor 2 family protein n=1 Tax=Pseudonocardia sp. TRM90224 TaxID=2812678 RepID=UPI001E2E6D37|nr:nuclear transport factor 2 family protein [Pseudonocardia sp. TRM90224]